MTITDEEARAVAAETQAGAPLPPLQALGTLAIVVVAIVVYEVLAALLHITPVFPGLLVLFYWAAVKHLALPELPWVILGSLGGVLNAALFVILIPVLGPTGGVLVALLAVIVAFYVLLTGWLPQVFNNAYMLLLTVAGIPEVLGAGRFLGMAFSVLLGAALFGALVGLPVLLKRFGKPRRPVAP